jgi:hypothetical protein
MQRNQTNSYFLVLMFTNIAYCMFGSNSVNREFHDQNPCLKQPTTPVKHAQDTSIFMLNGNGK